mmetsp:Transcript_73280/g.231422  ORF Transcript_73280/g.231422 Transcript_73280/m.231422 type:complete len:498 (+) Transcript_73280:355-1848(+)
MRQQQCQLGARPLALEPASPECRWDGIVVLIRDRHRESSDGRLLLHGQPHDGAVVYEPQAPVRQHEDVASVGVRVEKAVLKNLVPVHVEEQLREARPVQRHGDSPLGPLWRRSVAASAHASAYETGGEVAHLHRCDQEEGLLFAHLAHLHRRFHRLVLHVYLGGVLLVHLLLQLLCRCPVHLRKHLQQRKYVLPDGRALQAFHREHLARAERPGPVAWAGGVRGVDRERDDDPGPKVRHHVLRHFPHDGGLLCVIELLCKLVLHCLEDLLDLPAHAGKLHGEGHRVHVHLEEALHLWVLDLHGHLRAIVERRKVHLPDGRSRDSLLLEISEDILELTPQLLLNDVLDNVKRLLRALIQEHRERVVKLPRELACPAERLSGLDVVSLHSENQIQGLVCELAVQPGLLLLPEGLRPELVRRELVRDEDPHGRGQELHPARQALEPARAHGAGQPGQHRANGGTTGPGAPVGGRRRETPRTALRLIAWLGFLICRPSCNR